MVSATAWLLLSCSLFAIAYSTHDTSRPVYYRQATNIKTIDNGIIEIGIDLDRGGSITYLSQSKKNFNIINIHDMGREVQLSFYSGPDNYEPSPGSHACNTTWHHGAWPWNPIGAGDVTGNTGQILDVQVDDNNNSMYIKSKPLQWACDNVPCECVFEKWITLSGTTAVVKASLTNSRSDMTFYGGRDQELPAVYTTGYLHRLFTYSDTEPFTKSPAKELPTGPNSPNAFLATEHWAAMVDNDGWGLGVYQPEATEMLGRFFGDHPGKGGPTDDATGYIAPINQEILDWNIVYNFSFYLILGDLDTIRNKVYDLNQKLMASCLNSEFVMDRHHFTVINAVDSGVPKQFWQIMMEKNDPELIGPVCFWQAVDHPKLYINASYSTKQASNSTTGQIFWAKQARNFNEQNSITFDVKADGLWHEYEVDLSQVATYTGPMYGLRFDPVVTGAPESYINLASILTKD